MYKQWKPILNSNGKFEVSNLGDVRYTENKKPVKLNKGGRGYLFFSRSIKGKQKSFVVHICVCKEFHGQPPSPQHQVNHKDGNKLNNNKNNLEWVTKSENIAHAYKIGLMNKVGSNHPKAKVSENQVKEIRKLYSSGNYTQKQLGKMFGLTENGIGGIIRKTNWSHV